jgi:outer membrane protein assembly factor BamB
MTENSPNRHVRTHAVAILLIAGLVFPAMPQMSPAVEPVPQLAERFKFENHDPSLYDDFGRAVAIDDGRAVVSVGAAITQNSFHSRAHVYDAETGQQLNVLTSPPGVDEGSFGNFIDVDGGMIIVGDSHAGPNNRGAAHVFDAASGAHIRTISPPGFATFLGDSVAISGQHALVSNNLFDDLKYYNAVTGVERPPLLAPDPKYTLIPKFDIDGDRAMIVGVDKSGSADVAVAFVIDLNTRELISTLRPTDQDQPDFRRVAIDGNRAIMGALQDADHRGAAYVFDVQTGQQLHKLVSPFPRSGNVFGADVDIDGSLAVVGSPNDRRRGSQSGAAYVFNIETGSLLTELVPSDIRAGDWFGIEVSIDQRNILVGATRNQQGATHGAAYIFSVIPEPSSLLLLGSGALAAIFRRRLATQRHRAPTRSVGRSAIVATVLPLPCGERAGDEGALHCPPTSDPRPLTSDLRFPNRPPICTAL